jgi:hypothetical protein
MSFVINISVLLVALGIVMMTMIALAAVFSQDSAENGTVSESTNVNETVGNNKNMMMPGGNMTFGSSLDNARMHLMQAIMDLNEGNTKGALMQLNMTEEGISLHEKEMMEMMTIMKQNISIAETEVENKTS